MEASLCSSTFFGSVIAASSPGVPFSVAFDIAGVASRHVKRVLTASASRARRRSKRSSGICRANSSCEQPRDGRDGELLEVEVGKMEKGGGGAWRSGPGIERFRGSPLPDFEDEFFARMMALEASPLSSSRASSSSSAAFFEGSTLCAGCEPPRPSSGQGVESPGPALGTSTGAEQIGVLGMSGVQLPSSIKKLRRRTSDSRVVRSVRESGCAIKRAFSSMVYMIKAVQSHALQIRQALFSDKWDVQQVLHVVDREMHSSFVWLFQRVFACTPTLMVSVMILLANFTVFSMGENVAAVTATDQTPASNLSPYALLGNSQASPSSPPPSTFPSVIPLFPLPASGYGAGGNNNFPSAPTAQGFDGDSKGIFEHNRTLPFSEEESPSLNHDSGLGPVLSSWIADSSAGDDDDHQRPSTSHREMVKAWVESTMKNQVTQLEQETTQRLVAPVVAHLASDKYACFDRTDLEYQLALAKDPTSAVLLSNYAQFLFVVRRDNDRAEQYFHRAIEADPQDSSILGRFASFLWLGRGNRSGAERAYKAAMAAAPESSYPAGSYAHFLWHASEVNL